MSEGELTVSESGVAVQTNSVSNRVGITRIFGLVEWISMMGERGEY